MPKINLSKPLIQGSSSIIAPIYWQFLKDLSQPRQAQDRVKNKIIQKLNKTVYGSQLNIKNREDWQQIPIIDYDTIEPWIKQQQQQPSASILTPEKIHFWESTSGSTGAKKNIPYTTSLLGSFSNMFCIWAYDLIKYGPCFSTGKTYLCISPEIAQGTQGTDDSAYISPYLRWFLTRFLLRVQGRFSTVEDFRWTLACVLLEAADLEIFSLWSPSFLTTQLDFIQANNQQLYETLKHRMSCDRRQRLLEPEIPWGELWPELKLISCWDRQYAADSAQTLKHYFPKVFVQGKGLLATEAPMTIPLLQSNGFVPLLNQVVFEFLDPQHQLHSLTELELGVTYELIISQLGGLSRYKIGDRVQVSHWYLNTPCLNFVGRGEQVSDLVGEKLTIEFVRKCFNQLGYLQRGFCCLVPVMGNPPYYCLLLEQSQEDSQTIIEKLENILQQSFHYQKARQFNQLGQLQVIIDPQVTQYLQTNKRSGDCKYPILLTKPLDSK
ncbi:GH3 family domain-containing protein [Crocosphaera sp.]|uniref:GH3 family domain-containing protein n=1 Tax=Crocosphaera sp. TaxID=2729996 RepID=UPI003F2361F6|nr:GH3 auxin-responsive promoter family protein [Crocosphaera sp.]